MFIKIEHRVDFSVCEGRRREGQCMGARRRAY